MKNLKTILLVTFIALFIVSCSKDDDSADDTTTQNRANILGTWKFTSSTTNGNLDTDNDPCLTELTVSFNATQVTTVDVYGTNCEMSETYTNAYSISGNTISFVDEGDTYASEITTLNSTTFTIKDNEGNDVYTETYTKQ